MAKYTKANTIEYKALDNGEWLYVLQCKKPKEFAEWADALTATEIHLKKIRCFKPVLDDGNSTDGKVSLNPQFEGGFKPTGTWRNRRATEKLLSLDRLNRQLRVDFAIDVHGAEGKRRRGKTKTIYDEETPKATEEAMTDTEEVVASKKGKKADAKPKLDSFAEKALDVISKAHADVVAAKDETIKALTTALVAKEELIMHMHSERS